VLERSPARGREPPGVRHAAARYGVGQRTPAAAAARTIPPTWNASRCGTAVWAAQVTWSAASAASAPAAAAAATEERAGEVVPPRSASQTAPTTAVPEATSVARHSSPSETGGRLHRRPDARPALRGRELASHRSRRGSPRRVRPASGQLCRAAGSLLANPRFDERRPPGPRPRQPVPVRDLHLRAGAAGSGPRVSGRGAGPSRGPDHDGDRSGRPVLARGARSPAVGRETRVQVLPGAASAEERVAPRTCALTLSAEPPATRPGTCSPHPARSRR
jgi:hypothetical protein